MSQQEDNSFIAEALPAFISEAGEQLEMLEQLLLQLEDEPDSQDLLGALFRCAHTVKGSAGIFGLDEVVAFTHHVETLLDRLRDGAVTLTPAMSTLLLQCNDQIRFLIGLAQTRAPADEAAVARRADLEARLQAFSGDSAHAIAAAAGPAATTSCDGAPVQDRPWHVNVAFQSDTFRNGMDPLAVLNYVRGLGAMPRITCDTSTVPGLDTLDPESCHLAFDFDLITASTQDAIESAFSFVREDCTLTITPPAEAEPVAPVVAEAAAAPATSPKAAPAKAREGGATAVDDQRFIRVQADRLDAVINLLGELVIAGAGASLLARASRQGSLIEANEQISGLIEEIRNGTLQLRMVPIGETFSRFRRVVRDTAAELGKGVQLEIVGGETELDKSVVERIADPLMHLVRNGLDHGLETPEQRIAAGKPAQGKLILSACHESGSILIRITDDGRGVQREKVLARAWERGLVEQGVVPPDADILKLIFEPGFSTAEKVTNLSGRGVGYGRGPPQHRGPARLGAADQRGRPGFHHRDPPATHAGHHRRLPDRRRRLALHLPARRGGGGDREPPHRHRAGRQRARRCRAARPGAAGGEPARAVRAGVSGTRARERGGDPVCQAALWRAGGPAAGPAPDRDQAAGSHVPQPARHVGLFHPGQRRRGPDL